MKKILNAVLSGVMLATCININTVCAENPATETISYNYDYKSEGGYAEDGAHTRQMEKLGRGLTAIQTNDGVYLSWRLLDSEDVVYGSAKKFVSFNVYRDGIYIANVSESTNYTDTVIGESYSVAPVTDEVEGEKCETVSVRQTNYIDITLDRPETVSLPRLVSYKTASQSKATNHFTSSSLPVSEITEDLLIDDWRDESTYYTNEYTYKVGDCSAGDLDGDGEYEIVVKWDANPQDNSNSGVTGNVYLDAYNMQGDKLWRIDLGKNIRGGEHYTQFLVYDFDLDGKAEITCKTAPGSKDASGRYVTAASHVDEIKNITDEINETDYRNGGGYVLDGDEYLTVFNGMTGEAMDTIYYPNQRIHPSVWGDTYGNRCDRFTASVAYIDGEKPYAFYMRGYYMRQNGGVGEREAACAVSFDGSELECKYSFDTYDANSSQWKSNSPSYADGVYKGVDGYKSGYEKYVGQGNHNCTVADVDNDGRDEVITGALCYELKDGALSPRWCTFMEHGDAMHIGDYDPVHEGLEFFTVHEDSGPNTRNDGNPVEIGFGMSVIDAKTGEIVFHETAGDDTGRGIMANIGMGGYYQIWSSKNDLKIAKGGTEFENGSKSGLSMNFRVFWDDDLYDELLDGTAITGYTDSGMRMLFNASSYDCKEINGTKAVPALQADLFGDWREEVVYPTREYDRLRIFSTTIPTEYKMKTLMHDPVYRSGVAAEQTAYNQPPHVGFYMDDTVVNGPIEEIEITELPLKREYIKGEPLDVTGLKVNALHLSGKTQELTKYKLTGYDPNVTGVQNITVETDDGAEAQFSVNVSDGTRYLTENFENGSVYVTQAMNEERSADFGMLKFILPSTNRMFYSSMQTISSDNIAYLHVESSSASTAHRGGRIEIKEECGLPSFSSLMDNEKLVINLTARYLSDASTMQIFGVTSSTESESMEQVYDPYLSVKNNTNIPVGEWVNIKIEIDNTRSAKLVITDKAGDKVSEQTFTATGNEIGKFAFYANNFRLDISNISVYSTAVLTGLEIKEPSQLEYEPGEDLDLEGMEVYAIYDSGSEKLLTSDDYTVSGYDAGKIGTQTITVTYKDKSETFDITVNAANPVQLTAEYIGTKHYVGTPLTGDNLTVTAHYPRGGCVVVDDYEISGFDHDTLGTQTVTISALGLTVNIDIIVVSSSVYYFDDYNSYTKESITMTRQGTDAQSQELGDLNLAIGRRDGTGDNVSGFAIANGCLNIHSGAYATASRGASMTFAESCQVPRYADTANGRYLVLKMDAYYNDKNANIQIKGLTDSTKSTKSTPVNDAYLSVAKNAKIPVKEWINITIAVDNKSNALMIIRKKSDGSLISTQSFKAAGETIEGFCFYGSTSMVRIDSMSVFDSDSLLSIDITPPEKTMYKLSEELDTSGLTVFANYIDTSRNEVFDYTVSGYAPEIPGKQLVTVMYKRRMAFFEVEVEAPKPTVQIVNELDLDNGTLSGTVTAVTEHVNPSCAVILAVYDAAGIMRSMQIKSAADISFEPINLTDIQAGTYKVLVWDSMPGMQPVCHDAKTFGAGD